MNTTPLVWLVDDDPDDQFIIQVLFRNMSPSMTIRILRDGGELLHQLQEASSLPKLILLDLNMKHVNGFEALRQIRANPDYQALPIVVLTFSVDPRDKEEALRLGATAYLSKSPHMTELAAQLSLLVQEWVSNEA